MKYKYMAISGKEIEMETDKTEEQLISDFVNPNDNTMWSMTPLVEVNGKEYWNRNTEWGNFTKKQWIKKVCPQLVKIYG